MGLPESHHIGRVLVHPKNPDIVYVAVAGHEYTHNEERGVYKTTDGGETWNQVFYRDAKTGAIDLVMDPTAPDTLYLGTAERLRYHFSDPKPGPQTGIYKTTDGGGSWQALTKGLPDFTKGHHERVGLSVCQSQSKTIYAVINQAGGRSRYYGAHVFRSDDAGETWRDLKARSVRRLYATFGWFFGQIRVDPNDPETVFVLGVNYAGSNDGGKTWDMRLARGHVDYHAMWINPANSKHILLGNDGGLMISHDQLRTAQRPRNLPIAQAYNVACSQEQGGFWLYLSCQDNGAWRGRVDLAGGRDKIERQLWESAPGDESGRHAVDPTNPNLVYSVSRYGSNLQRTVYTPTPPIAPGTQDPGGQGEGGQAQGGQGRVGRGTDRGRARGRGRGTPISPRFEGERRRAQWVSPLIISPVDPKRLLYGAQFVFLSDDQGDNWRQISPDLSNFDPARQGNIAHAVVFSLAESKVEKGVIYAGTDDGNVQVTRDEGKTWTKVNAGLPAGRCIASLEASQFAKGSVYVAVNGKRHDDFGTYVYASTDYGAHWRLLSVAVPGGPVNAVKQDPAGEQILYLGTDRGVYVSTDAGAQWHVLGKGLPTVYVHDLAIQTVEDYLVAATHGRGHWVLDIRELRRRRAR
jgi:photosystem II stability/assembly factor-like uncharacterized protein